MAAITLMRWIFKFDDQSILETTYKPLFSQSIVGPP